MLRVSSIFTFFTFFSISYVIKIIMILVARDSQMRGRDSNRVTRQFPEGRSRALGSRAMLKDNEYYMFSSVTAKIVRFWWHSLFHFYDICEGSLEFSQVQVCGRRKKLCEPQPYTLRNKPTSAYRHRCERLRPILGRERVKVVHFRKWGIKTTPPAAATATNAAFHQSHLGASLPIFESSRTMIDGESMGPVRLNASVQHHLIDSYQCFHTNKSDHIYLYISSLIKNDFSLRFFTIRAQIDYD